MHHDRFARHQLAECRIEKRLDLRVANRSVHDIFLGKVEHPECNRIDLGRSPVALELQLCELIIQCRADLRARGETFVELAKLLRKRKLRVDCFFDSFADFAVFIKIKSSIDLDIRIKCFIDLDYRLGKIHALELVKRLERLRGSLGEVFQPSHIRLAQDALLDQRLSDGFDILYRVCSDGLFRRSQEQHIQLADDAFRLRLHRLCILRGIALNLLGLIGVDLVLLLQIDRGTKVHVHLVESTQRI